VDAHLIVVEIAEEIDATVMKDSTALPHGGGSHAPFAVLSAAVMVVHGIVTRMSVAAVANVLSAAEATSEASEAVEEVAVASADASKRSKR
jgi:hypothetical protein